MKELVVADLPCTLADQRLDFAAHRIVVHGVLQFGTAGPQAHLSRLPLIITGFGLEGKGELPHQRATLREHSKLPKDCYCRVPAILE